jgi:hypothetical protein
MREFQSLTHPSRVGAAATGWHSLGDHVDGAAGDLCDDKGKPLTAKGEGERSAPYAPHIHAQIVVYLLSSLRNTARGLAAAGVVAGTSAAVVPAALWLCHEHRGVPGNELSVELEVIGVLFGHGS